MLALKRIERPRELKWYQAGAMLYGDWGTSKAYVLGIAFALAGHASWLLLGFVSALTMLIGVCYTIVCRMYPDGGGVYSSTKVKSRTLAVVGALLLVADYVVTASLSALAAFHYFGFAYPERWAIGAILAIGLMNWVGPSKGSGLASVVALVASLSAVVLVFATVPSLSRVELSWPEGGFGENWSNFVAVVLALSGVESIANMTGIMVQPVEKTSRKAILPVLFEVSILTFLLGIAMNAIPGLTNHTEDMLRALGNYYIGPWYGQFISIAFGLLLLSAANTAIGSFVSIQFVMARDRELPSPFGRLNRFGMPYLGLIVATAVPILILVLESNILHLAAFYAIGVVGAITLNIGACAFNGNLPMKPAERNLLMVAGAIMLLIELTIAFQKHNALMFVLIVLGTGLALRYFAKLVVPAPISEEVLAVNVLTVSEAKELAALYRSSSLVALKSLNLHLLEEAALRMKARGENSIYLAYVEETPPSRDLSAEVEPSPHSVELLGRAQKEMEARGITAVPIWRIGHNPGKLIADAARELEVETVMMGATKRSALENLLRGEVFRMLARNLPNECHLVING